MHLPSLSTNSPKPEPHRRLTRMRHIHCTSPWHDWALPTRSALWAKLPTKLQSWLRDLGTHSLLCVGGTDKCDLQCRHPCFASLVINCASEQWPVALQHAVSALPCHPQLHGMEAFHAFTAAWQHGIRAFPCFAVLPNLRVWPHEMLVRAKVTGWHLQIMSRLPISIITNGLSGCRYPSVP